MLVRAVAGWQCHICNWQQTGSGSLKYVVEKWHMAVSGLWHSDRGMYVDLGSSRLAVALCSWGQWLGRSGTSVDGSSGSGTLFMGSVAGSQWHIC